MRTKFILTATLLVSGIIAMAQTVQQKQMAFMAKKTATWCNPCGTWGWQLFDDIVTTNKSKAVIFELHESSSSQLYSAAALSLYNTKFETVSSTPAFYVNGINVTQYSGTGGIYPSLTKNRVDALVDSFAALTPLANAGFTTSVSGTNLTIQTKTKFFSSATGEYYLAVYLTERNVVKYQNGIGNTAVHKNPFRDKASANIMGDLIASGSIASSSEYDKSFNYNLKTDWKPSDVKVVLVIWKKNGSTYEYVNAFSENAFTTALSETDRLDNAITLYPTLASSQEQINLDIDRSLLNENLSIKVFDMYGKCVHLITNSIANDHTVSYDLNPYRDLVPGLYFASVTFGSKAYTQKFVVR